MENEHDGSHLHRESLKAISFCIDTISFNASHYI